MISYEDATNEQLILICLREILKYNIENDNSSNIGYFNDFILPKKQILLEELDKRLKNDL